MRGCFSASIILILALNGILQIMEFGITPPRRAARVIAAEAASEGFWAMVAVGEVIRARGSFKGFSVMSKDLDDFFANESPATRQKAHAAWTLSKFKLLAGGATHFENVRLYGWVLFFIKNGVLDGSLRAAGFGGGPDILFTPGMILAGMVYTYLPFMLFPMTLGLAMVPKDLIDAARDLGASRLQIWREVELPLAMPGILIGMLLTFVLGIGAVAEAKILGGQSVIVIAHDIEIAFTYSQNWPLGSALAVVITLFIGVLTLAVFGKLDLDRLLGRR